MRPLRPFASRPRLEDLESRVVLSHAAPAPILPLPIHVTAVEVSTLYTNPKTGLAHLSGEVAGTVAGQPVLSPFSGLLTPPHGKGGVPSLSITLPAANSPLSSLQIETGPATLTVAPAKGANPDDALLVELTQFEKLIEQAPRQQSPVSLNLALAQPAVLNAIDAALTPIGGRFDSFVEYRNGYGVDLKLSLEPTQATVSGVTVQLRDSKTHGPVPVDIIGVVGPGLGVDLINFLGASSPNLIKAIEAALKEIETLPPPP